MISDQLLEWLNHIPDRAELKYELQVMQAIKRWAIEEVIGFDVGDVVEFVANPARGGWAPYAEALSVGARADVMRISFNTSGKYWYANIVLHREWSLGELTGDTPPIRYWHGPVDKTPEGMEPPSTYDQENYPEGRKHTFSMPVKFLKLVANEDVNTD